MRNTKISQHLNKYACNSHLEDWDPHERTLYLFSDQVRLFRRDVKTRRVVCEYSSILTDCTLRFKGWGLSE